MVYSMTGFARGKIGGYVIEIQTVNKKGVEISISLPRELVLKESLIRRKLSTLMQRGHASVKVFSEHKEEQKISKEACIKAHAYLVEIAKELDPNFLVSFDNVLAVLSSFDVVKPDDEVAWESGLNDLWGSLNEMRLLEGKRLVDDLLTRVETILKEVDVIEKENRLAPDHYRKKILDKLESLKAVSQEDRDRVIREVILISEKIDITEEIVRMRSHILQIRKLFESGNEPIGRTIDFLIQEMHREANTMGSKVPDLTSLNSVITIKSEIEKIRQQGSNIE